MKKKVIIQALNQAIKDIEKANCIATKTCLIVNCNGCVLECPLYDTVCFLNVSKDTVENVEKSLNYVKACKAAAPFTTVKGIRSVLLGIHPCLDQTK